MQIQETVGFGSLFLYAQMEVIGLPTVVCKLVDCSKHGRDICIARNISIDGVGQCECYDPVPGSSVVHCPAKSVLDKRRGRWVQRKGGSLK